jgi:hypothetical protein
MPKEQGLGMGAFFAVPRGPSKTPEQDLSTPTVRTTITLKVEDADRLDYLRMCLRHHQGRSLTYGDVVGLALKRLAETEQATTQPPQT